MYLSGPLSKEQEGTALPSRRSAEQRTVASCWWSFWDNALPSSEEKSISPRVEPISWRLFSPEVQWGAQVERKWAWLETFRKASEVRGRQGTGKPGQTVQEAEACPGPSLWRTLLTLQLTAKQDVGQGPVYTADHYCFHLGPPPVLSGQITNQI